MSDGPSLRRITLFWLPLASTWLMMALEGPFLAAVIARLAEPKVNLAAYGVAFSLALIVEAPIIMMMSASTALVRDAQTLRALWRFTAVLNAAITAAMVVLVLPPVFDVVAGTLLGLPDDVAARTHLATAILLPWPGAIGFRRFYQGVLIRGDRTRRVAYGTVLRLVTMAATGAGCALFTDLPGAAVGAAALAVGVSVEAVASRAMAARLLAELAATPQSGEPLTLPGIARFYWPLAMTSLLTLGVHPIVTFFMGHARAPLDSLAVLPVVNSLVFVFRSLGLAYQEVAIALLGERWEGYEALRRFALLLGVAAAGGLGIIVWTPLAGVWFEGVSGLDPELARFALTPARIVFILPGLTVLLSFQRSMLVNLRRTGPITWATAAEVAGVVSVLAIGIGVLDGVGAVVAAVAFLVGRLAANAYLAPPLLRWIPRARAAADAGSA